MACGSFQKTINSDKVGLRCLLLSCPVYFSFSLSLSHSFLLPPKIFLYSQKNKGKILFALHVRMVRPIDLLICPYLLA